MDYRENARLTVHSREHMAKMLVDQRCAMTAHYAGLAVLLEHWLGNQGLWRAFICFMVLRGTTLGLRLPGSRRALRQPRQRRRSPEGGEGSGCEGCSCILKTDDSVPPPRLKSETWGTQFLLS